jgi:hypothetical protein
VKLPNIFGHSDHDTPAPERFQLRPVGEADADGWRTYEKRAAPVPPPDPDPEPPPDPNPPQLWGRVPVTDAEPAEFVRGRFVAAPVLPEIN